jgi:hypothetical protein
MRNIERVRKAAYADDTDNLGRNHIPMTDALFWNFNQTISAS